MATNVQFEDVNVGDTIPAWSRMTDFMSWNRFAAVNDEFVYIHMDDEAGRAALNEQGAFGMGNLRYTYVLNALRDWIGDEAEIREVGVQFRAINQKNDVLTVTGKVTDRRSRTANTASISTSTSRTNRARRPARDTRSSCCPRRAEPR